MTGAERGHRARLRFFCEKVARLLSTWLFPHLLVQKKASARLPHKREEMLRRVARCLLGGVLVVWVGISVGTFIEEYFRSRSRYEEHRRYLSACDHYQGFEAQHKEGCHEAREVVVIMWPLITAVKATVLGTASMMTDPLNDFTDALYNVVPVLAPVIGILLGVQLAYLVRQANECEIDAAAQSRISTVEEWWRRGQQGVTDFEDVSSVSGSRSRSRRSRSSMRRRAAKITDSEAAEGEATCAVCLVNKRKATFVPCGHFACCWSCAQECNSATSKCPVCQAVITSVVATYQP
jgi:hypothetical protein